MKLYLRKVSLLHYDDVKAGLEVDPSPGYPIICVTPCDPKYPQYVDTQNLCEEAAINVSTIKYGWEVSQIMYTKKKEYFKEIRKTANQLDLIGKKLLYSKA